MRHTAGARVLPKPKVAMMAAARPGVSARRRDAAPAPPVIPPLTFGTQGRPVCGDIKASVRTRAYWHVMRGAFRDKRGQAIWLMACATPACGGTLRLALHKAKGHTTCERCRYPRTHNHQSNFLEKHPEIVATRIRKCGTHHHLCRCENPGCEETFWHTAYLRGRRQCLACDHGKVYFQGRLVRNAKLRAAVDHIGGLREDASGEIVFLMRCRAPGCSGLYRSEAFVNRGTLYCFACLRERARNRPYENQWRRLVSKRAQEIAQPVPLTYAQFVRLCALPACFYCRKVLARSRFAGHAGSGAIFLDRLNSEGAYDFSNVVPCCGPCNRTKGAWLSGHEFLAVIAMRLGDAKALALALSGRRLTWGVVAARCTPEKGHARALPAPLGKKPRKRPGRQLALPLAGAPKAAPRGPAAARNPIAREQPS